jgi:hypothetical protein
MSLVLDDYLLCAPHVYNQSVEGTGLQRLKGLLLHPRRRGDRRLEAVLPPAGTSAHGLIGVNPVRCLTRGDQPVGRRGLTRRSPRWCTSRRSATLSPSHPPRTRVCGGSGSLER